MSAETNALLGGLLPIVADTVGLPPGLPLNAETRFESLNLDSVSTLEFLLGVEQAFQVELDARELLESGSFETVGSLASFITSKGGKLP